MGRIVLVFRNAFRGILHARSLYLWIIGILIVGMQLAPQIIFRDNLPNFAAAGAGRQRPVPPGLTEEQQKQLEELQRKALEARLQQAQEQFRRNRPVALANGMRTWSYLAILFGILLGANALASEIAAKTIITVLARPISRWELLFGKWLAIQSFGAMSLLVGVAIHFAAGWYLSVTFSSVLWLALLHSMVSIMLYSAAALALGTMMGPLVAAGIAAMVFVLPDFITFLKEDTTEWVRLLGTGLDWVVPPGFKSIFAQSVNAALELDHSALSKTLVENLAYCGVFFVLGCVIFSRREVRLG